MCGVCMSVHVRVCVHTVWRDSLVMKGQSNSETKEEKISKSNLQHSSTITIWWLSIKYNI